MKSLIDFIQTCVNPTDGFDVKFEAERILLQLKSRGYLKFGKIQSSRELFSIEKTGEDSYNGLVYPVDGCGIYPYGFPSLSVCIYPFQDAFFASIGSYDDSGVSFFGKSKSIELIRVEIQEFLYLLESLNFACPTKEDFTEFCDKNEVTYSYW